MRTTRRNRTHFNGTAALGKPCRTCGSMERFVSRDQCAPCARAKAQARAEQTFLERSFYHARRRAAKDGREFSIKLEDLAVPEICPVLGVPLEKPSLALLDRSKGYTPGNVRVISWRANQLKLNGTLAEFARLVAFLAETEQGAGIGSP